MVNVSHPVGVDFLDVLLLDDLQNVDVEFIGEFHFEGVERAADQLDPQDLHCLDPFAQSGFIAADHLVVLILEARKGGNIGENRIAIGNMLCQRTSTPKLYVVKMCTDGQDIHWDLLGLLSISKDSSAPCLVQTQILYMLNNDGQHPAM